MAPKSVAARAPAALFFAHLKPAMKARHIMQAPVRSRQTLESIWQVVQSIPRGCVATYGAIAGIAGLPGRARLVGHALKVAPADLRLPWHRVVGAGGRIAFPRQSREFLEQCRRLRGEGVSIRQGRVHDAHEMDELPWKP
jgi:methylated-DNA-protein-cysteine methyltransferase related protein